VFETKRSKALVLVETDVIVSIGFDRGQRETMLMLFPGIPKNSLKGLDSVSKYDNLD